MPKKKVKKNEGQIEKEKLKTIPKTIEDKDNYKIIKPKKNIIKHIGKNGNSFYRTLSYFYKDIEDDYNQFRNLIISFIEEHKNQYIDHITEEEAEIPKESVENEEIKILKKTEYLNKYIKETYKDAPIPVI